jgi:hypothetical protein
MRILETVPAAFVILASAGVFFGTTGLNYWDGVTPGARFFPAALSAVGAAIGLGLLYAQSRGIERVDVDLPDRRALLRVAASVVALTMLAMAAPLIGLIPALFVFVVGMLVLILRQKPLLSLLVAGIVAGFVHLVFVRWLSVPLPQPFGF